MTKENQHLVLIDGYGFVFRAFHAFPPLKRDDGVNVGAIYGFTSMITKVILEFSCSHLAVALDSGGKTFRHDIFSEYKSHRPPAPEELIPQFPLVREAVASLNVDVLEKPGFEADDIIATLAKTASNLGIKVTIISSDKDLMQLIDDNISMYDPMKSRYIKAEQVIEKFGVNPNQVIDMLALIGDSADYVPGVPSIGPKTAAELIQKYSNIDGIYRNIDVIPNSKRKQSLIDNKDLAYLSQKLVILDDKVPVGVELNDIRIKISHVDQFKEFLQKQNFSSLHNRAEKICQAFNLKNEEHQDPMHSIRIKELDNLSDLDQWLKTKTAATGQLSIIFEAGILSLSCDNREIIVCNKSSSFELFQKESQFSVQDFAKSLKPYINDSSIIKIVHDAKCLYHIFADYIKIDPSAWQTTDDIQLISYVLNNGVHSHDLKTLIQTYFSLDTELELEQWLGYSSFCISQLWSQFKQRLPQEKALVLYERIEKPLSLILYKMENAGIKIDQNRLKEIALDFTKRCSELEQNIYQLAGCEFNIGSPKQMSEILFNKLGLKTNIKTAKNKNLSTSAETLEELAIEGHEIAKFILDWRHLTKLNNTYASSLSNNAKDNRIHTNFQMTITSTGRLSSINPNLQNIPTRSEDGIKIRSAFIADNNNLLISADYSQVELRLLAHMASIPTLSQAFLNDQDIHSLTASEIFHINLNEVTPELRYKAKAINFGIIYGLSSFGLANQLRIPKSEANKYIEAYFEHYPGIKQYIENTKNFARENGFVETIFGRRCYTKSINDSNGARRSFAERAAVNATLQGSVADIIKKAAISLNYEIEQKKLPARILLQIHDELLLEVRQDAVKEVSFLTKKIMESVIKLSIPLKTDVSFAENWAKL